MKPTLKPVRCAIYTRKSSEEGLDQAFNSLDAQREACEAYVTSQAGEGWKALPARYDDGGFSGGNMDRPALAKLLADVDAGLIDTIVVYKIDRLTRSLGDFSKIVERLDAVGASFVSVTQAFNTTSSMGRLTLNVLLSFAQFEREVTGERIRDKIAASKAKGMWMGGVPPLGYDKPTDLVTRALVINESEADTVRCIFKTYLELGSVALLAAKLETDGVRSKLRVTEKGAVAGGAVFSRGALFHLLRNRIYVGDLPHQGVIHRGAQLPIIDQVLFDAVQARLKQNAVVHKERPMRSSTAPLKGRLFDAEGEPMSPSYTHGDRGQIYRYYVSTPLQQGRRLSPSPEIIRRVPGNAIDAVVLDALSRIVPDLGSAWPTAKGLVARVEVYAQSLHLILNRQGLGAGGLTDVVGRICARLGEGGAATADSDLLLRVVLPIRLVVRGGRTWIQTPKSGVAASRARIDRPLVKALRTAHKLIRANGLDLKSGPVDQAPANPYDRRICLLAYLAPEIQTAILKGRQPATLTLERLSREDIPLSWKAQKIAYGF